MGHYHAVLWIDHHEAKIIHFNATDAETKVVRSDNKAHHLHSRAGSPAGRHLRGDAIFFKSIADALDAVSTFLVIGPAGAGHEFEKYLAHDRPNMTRCLAAVEASARVTDAQLLAYARSYFKLADRMMPQGNH